jgi:hypothetical protein
MRDLWAAIKFGKLKLNSENKDDLEYIYFIWCSDGEDNPFGKNSKKELRFLN